MERPGERAWVVEEERIRCELSLSLAVSLSLRLSLTLSLSLPLKLHLSVRADGIHHLVAEECEDVCIRHSILKALAFDCLLIA
jgi:hypothetical protein